MDNTGNTLLFNLFPIFGNELAPGAYVDVFERLLMYYSCRGVIGGMQGIHLRT